jgi:nitroreductase
MNQALQGVIEHRRTTNVFEPNHTISDEQIEHLVHLATRAPISFNLQNWRFLGIFQQRYVKRHGIAATDTVPFTREA